MPDTSPPPTSRRFSPTPVETTVKKVRRFAPEPVETTARSSKKEDVQKAEDGTTERKDFAHALRRFPPQPIEASFKTSRPAGNLPPPSEHAPETTSQRSPPGATPKPRRRFTPELIETTKRSSRASDSRPATLPTDKVNNTALLFIYMLG